MIGINYDSLAADYALNRSICPSVRSPLLTAAQQPTIHDVLEVGCDGGPKHKAVPAIAVAAARQRKSV